MSNLCLSATQLQSVIYIIVEIVLQLFSSTLTRESKQLTWPSCLSNHIVDDASLQTYSWSKYRLIVLVISTREMGCKRLPLLINL